MDPLSVSASIIGILEASAKVSSVLIAFVRSTKAAPKLAQTVLSQVNDLSAILTHLQITSWALRTHPNHEPLLSWWNKSLSPCQSA